MAPALLLALAVLLPSQAEPKPDRWEKEIRSFAEQDAKSRPATGGVVFVGSSSIRLWKLDQCFPGKNYVNRGFGGSVLSDSVRLADKFVTQYKPRTVVLYAGDNDIAAGKSPEIIRDDYRKFVETVRKDLPDVRIIYIAIKPSPKRWALATKAQTANRLIRGVQGSDPRQVFVDVWEAMIGPDGLPNRELFVKDELHMAPAGYAIWTRLLQPHLARPPNVVLCFADDLGYGDVGCFGSKTIRTPNIDRLASEGIRLTDFYVAQAVCSASRAALMTGRYSNRVGVLGALYPEAKGGIPDNEFTLAEMFKTRGYATCAVGKWHLGHLPAHLPTKHGFDEYLGLPYSNDMWPGHPTRKGFPPLPLYDGDKVVESGIDQATLTPRYVARAVDFIDRHKDQPFFLYVPFTFPHVPLHASHAGRSPHGLYADVVEEIDDAVGQMSAALKRHGLDNDTLMIFTSDNGPWLSYGNHGGSAGPLREGKGTTFEGGVRVPFVARWPGHIPAGCVRKEPVMTIDLLPTFAKLAGAALPANLQLDGQSADDVLQNAPQIVRRQPHFFYWGRQLQAVRSGPFKLHIAHPYNHVETPGRDGQPGKIVQQRIEQSLFDLAADPGETTDVSAKHPKELAALLAQAEQARQRIGDAPPRPAKGK